MARTYTLIAIITLIFSGFSTALFGQAKSKEFNKDEVIAEVKSQLDNISAESGELYTFCQEKNITGKYVFDITVEKKGNVLTVFMVSSDSKEIQAKNLLKDKLYSLRFENVKIPKKERIKIRHTLNF